MKFLLNHYPLTLGVLLAVAASALLFRCGRPAPGPDKVFQERAAASDRRDSAVKVILAGKAKRDSAGRVLDSARQELKPRAAMAHETIRRVAGALPDSEGDSLRAADSVIAKHEAVAEAEIDTLKKDTADLGAALRIKTDDARSWRAADSTDRASLLPAQQLAKKRLKGEIILGAIAAAAVALFILHN